MSELLNQQKSAEEGAAGAGAAAAAASSSSSGSGSGKATTHGVGDRTTYYKKWDQFAAESEQERAAEEAAAKAAAAEAEKNKPVNEGHKRDLEKREALKEAKKQWDGIKANEESMKVLVENETAESAGSSRVLSFGGVDEQRPPVVVLRSNSGCSYELAADTPVTKLFVERCTGLTLFLNCKLLTSSVEVSHCTDLTLVVGGAGNPVHTIQLDESTGVRVSYCGGAGGLVPEQCKLYHCGVRGLTIEHAYPAGSCGLAQPVQPVVAEKSQELDDFELASLVQVQGQGQAQAPIPVTDRQFVTTLNAAGELVTDLVLRDAAGHITTAREVEARKQAVLREVAARGLDANSEAVKAMLAECEPATNMRRAESCKEEGNKAFKASDYGQAGLHYTQAVDLLLQEQEAAAKAAAAGAGAGAAGAAWAEEDEAVTCKRNDLLCALYSNRAACSLKLGDHTNALADADRCLALQPTHVKSIFRKGLALHALGRYREACPVLGQALKNSPKDKQIQAALLFAERKLALEAQGGRGR